jgi:DNA helicase-2/ATP-dependent DNA helicase PcrA
MPYKLVAGTRFYERREVKDIIAYLRLVQNPYDSVSLLRIINVPARGIGQRSLDDLIQWSRSQDVPEYRGLQMLAGVTDKDTELPFNPRTVKTLTGFAVMLEELIEKSLELNLLDLFDAVVKGSGYRQYLAGLVDGEDRWENILELRGVAQEYRELPPREGLTAFLEGVALVSDIDGLEEQLDTVTLITLHQAKGLEFPVVFIVGMEDGILPHFRSIDDPEQLEEERRLCYVGITRAQRRVYLVRAFRRRFMGSSTVNQPSRFLKDIPSQLLSDGGNWEGEDRQMEAPETTWSHEGEPAYDAPELKPGDHVTHAQFGEGVVVSCQPVKHDAEVVVAFDGAGVKRLLLSFARLEKT